MAAPDLATEVSGAGSYPANRFNQRERKLLESVKTYVDSLSADTVITTQGDIIIGNASGNAARLAKGAQDTLLVAGASTVAYSKLVNANVDAAAAIAYSKLNLSNSLVAGDLTSGAVTTAKIGNDQVSLEHLDSGIEYSHRVFAAGSFTTAGGDAAESITVSGALNTDIAIVVLHTKGATPRTILTAQAATDAIDLEFSGDPSTDHIVRYMLLRASA